jgi:cephalosporin-C deacetylase
MSHFDLPLEHLRDYRPTVRVRDDFDEFWASTLGETRAFDLDVTAKRVENHLALVDTWDVTFSGFGGDRVRAWLHVPAGATGPLPTVVEYHGYSRGRGLPHQYLLYVVAGYAVFSMDTRGQGWTSPGDTPDPSGVLGTPGQPGLMVRGILDPKNYYFRRVYTDAVRAIEAARTFDVVDPVRVVVAGGSQGGGIAIAAAGLVHDLAGSLVDVPFLNHFERAITITDEFPYQEIVGYLARYRERYETVLDTLSYFDGVSFAARSSAPTLYSVALMDEVCPPSTVFAAYNAHLGAKEISVFPFNGHEGGGEFHEVEKLRWLERHFAQPNLT